MAKKLTSAKAKEILRDGTAQGHPLTAKQKGYFGAVAGGNSTGHHSTAQNVQSFDDRALGEQPPKVGNPLAGHPQGYTNPTSTGRPALAQQADGTSSPRETPATRGPTGYASPGKGVSAHPKGVDGYDEADTETASGGAHETRGSVTHAFKGIINDPADDGN